MKAIVYIHGYGSNSHTKKADAFASCAAKHGLEFVRVEYDSNAPFSEVQSSIKAQVEHLKEEAVIVVGTSLGGYWALKIAKTFGWYAAVMNPSIEPKKSLASYEEAQPIASSYLPLSIPDKGSVMVFLETGDTVLDWRHTFEVMSESPNVGFSISPGGSHRFESLNKVFKYIELLVEE